MVKKVEVQQKSAFTTRPSGGKRCGFCSTSGRTVKEVAAVIWALAVRR